MQNQGKEPDQPVVKPTFAAKFSAWWNGEDLPAPEAPMATESTPPPEPDAPLGPKIKCWTGDRIAVVQHIFGEGHTSPFDDAILKKMIDPLGLNEKMSVVEIGSELGGFARHIAKSTGAYVTSYETDEDLAQLGNELSVKAGLGKKAKLSHTPNWIPEIRKGIVDAVVSKESLFTFPDKKALFQSIRKSLKPGAQISLTDFVLESDPMGAELLLWQAHEPQPPHLLTAAQYRAELEDCELEVRIFEDMTDEYVRVLLGHFASFAEILRSAIQEDDRRRHGLQEAELWNRRMQALRSGLIKVYRIYARLTAN